jgi:hypothetical protein
MVGLLLKKRKNDYARNLKEIDRLLEIHGVYTTFEEFSTNPAFIKLRSLTGAILYIDEPKMHNLLIQGAPSFGCNLVDLKTLHNYEYTWRALGVKPLLKIPSVKPNHPALLPFKNNLDASNDVFKMVDAIDYIPIQWYWSPRHYGLLRALAIQKDSLAMELFSKSVTRQHLRKV